MKFNRMSIAWKVSGSYYRLHNTMKNVTFGWTEGVELLMKYKARQANRMDVVKAKT